ncbi:neutral zinc metallopeptidase [Metapseudomonas boanensis]|uniref:Neutral zinc metallopeptidase n=1 Tax=Metapseudomonas boanensis TaxID=2822138 RepID=A0ABS5XQV6_9GAMM|nr:neutral zinc metallopeptidase [Pseudomonas boanensis]MBT8769505.1 neutral zinc metallopeptidase [Pseudomonas boanensis]
MQGKTDPTNEPARVSEPRRRRRWPYVIGGLAVVATIGIFLMTGPMQKPDAFVPDDQGYPPLAEQAAPVAPPTVQPPKTHAEMLSTVLASSEDIWGELLARGDYSFKNPKTEFFDRSISSACGLDRPASGTFYCPERKLIYLDSSWFRDLDERFASVRHLAQAYLIAHQIGHHVQNLAGINSLINQARQRGDAMEGVDGLLVRKELQTDCLAGVWVRYAQRRQPWLAQGSMDEALKAVETIAQEHQQKLASGTVAPDPLTHATLELRTRWFNAGFQDGDPQSCLSIFYQGGD